jgi:hypothetical protein
MHILFLSSPKEDTVRLSDKSDEALAKTLLELGGRSFVQIFSWCLQPR